MTLIIVFIDKKNHEFGVYEVKNITHSYHRSLERDWMV